VELYREKYGDFGPALAAEKLKDGEGTAGGTSTVRRWLIGEGLQQSRRWRSVYRSRRERRARFGELVQFDRVITDGLRGAGHLLSDNSDRRCGEPAACVIL
jgi:hypothetical protein